jgi:dienelactone hydrolase
MTLSAIDYDADGVQMRGYFARAAGASAPGVLVAHEAPGVSDQVKERAEALADLGYSAFALDLYGQPYSVEEMMERHETMMAAPGRLLRRARAALDVLARQPGVDPARLGAIGYCQGGITALELARAGAPIRCAVGFHPGLLRPAGSPDGPITAKVLMLVGEADPVVPPEDRAAFAEEMRAKGADWQLHVFGGVGHSFTNPAVDELQRPGFAFDATADRRAWSMMVSLLEETLGAPHGRAAA